MNLKRNKYSGDIITEKNKKKEQVFASREMYSLVSSQEEHSMDELPKTPKRPPKTK